MTIRPQDGKPVQDGPLGLSGNFMVVGYADEGGTLLYRDDDPDRPIVAGTVSALSLGDIHASFQTSFNRGGLNGQEPCNHRSAAPAV